ncbi:hypothetical protein BS78_05G228000 [Paspalum vaginatum]|nr:hypothetical protein BS78_05G228000 [Paspalum vaginatum]
MASPEESGVPTRPPRRAGRRPPAARRRPPAAPVDHGAADLPRFPAPVREGSLVTIPISPLSWVSASGASSSEAGTRTRVRQSVLYSDRPRRSRPRRPAPGQEGRTVVDMPKFEELSLSDPPPLNPQAANEMRDETDDDEVPPEPVGFGFGTLGPQTLRSTAYQPRPKWLVGVRGQAMLKEHIDDASSGEHNPMATDSSISEALPVNQLTKKSTGDPDDDTEEDLRWLEEYFAANPPVSIGQALYELKVAEHEVLSARAAQRGWSPPPPPPPLSHFLVDQAQQEASTAASHPQHSTIHREPRREASTEEIVKNAKKWMHDEVMEIFQNYVGKRDDLKIADYQVDQLCHQCVNVENFNKIFHHYNFTVKLKKANSDDAWVVGLYFAEVMQVFGRKSYFCCALEPNDNGLCYACQNQGVDDLKHPATGGFDVGCPVPNDNGFNFWYTDE